MRQTRAIGPPAPSLAAYLEKVVPLVQSEARQLRALKRPTGTTNDHLTLLRYLSALDRVVGDYRRLEAAAKRGDTVGVATIEAALRASPVATLAASYGLRSCGTPGATTT